jgi:hypothetical protein
MFYLVHKAWATMLYQILEPKTRGCMSDTTQTRIWTGFQQLCFKKLFKNKWFPWENRAKVYASQDNFLYVGIQHLIKHWFLLNFLHELTSCTNTTVNKKKWTTLINLKLFCINQMNMYYFYDLQMDPLNKYSGSIKVQFYIDSELRFRNN